MTDLQELQEVELNLATTFVQICEKHKLRYYMIGGTFLGAIRHGGFIPWDDDMDFGMPRKDFEIFKQLTMEYTNLEVRHYSVSPDYKYSFMKLVDKSIQIQIHNGKEQQIVPSWIDIFPLDNVPKNKCIKKIFLLKLLILRMLISFKNIDRLDTKKKGRPFIEKVLMLIAVHANFSKLFSLQYLYKKLDKTLQRYPEEKAAYWINVMGSYKAKEIFPVAVFGKGSNYKFESKEFIGPIESDDYLHHLYGNYHKIPAKDDRNHHHSKILK